MFKLHLDLGGGVTPAHLTQPTRVLLDQPAQTERSRSRSPSPHLPALAHAGPPSGSPSPSWFEGATLGAALGGGAHAGQHLSPPERTFRPLSSPDSPPADAEQRGPREGHACWVGVELRVSTSTRDGTEQSLAPPAAGLAPLARVSLSIGRPAAAAASAAGPSQPEPGPATLAAGRSLAVRVSSGNPTIEVHSGVVLALDVGAAEPAGDTSAVCMLGAPSYLVGVELVRFLGHALAAVRHVRLMRAEAGRDRPGEKLNVVLLEFGAPSAAAAFRAQFDGARFSSLEPGAARVLPVLAFEPSNAALRGGSPVGAAAVAEPVMLWPSAYRGGAHRHGGDAESLPDASADGGVGGAPGAERLGLGEAPTCPVCLERLEPSADGPAPSAVFTTTCNHSFHVACLTRWARVSDGCPVCRHGEHSSSGSESACFECAATVANLICVVCGHIGCLRGEGGASSSAVPPAAAAAGGGDGHARSHFERTGHRYAMGLEQESTGVRRVWDYAGADFVDRLVLSKLDGTPVAMPAAERGGGAAGGAAEPGLEAEHADEPRGAVGAGEALALAPATPRRPTARERAPATPSPLELAAPAAAAAEPSARGAHAADAAQHAWRGTPPPPVPAAATPVERVVHEFSLLLASQLEAQRGHFEPLLAERAEAAASERHELRARIAAARAELEARARAEAEHAERVGEAEATLAAEEAALGSLRALNARLLSDQRDERARLDVLRERRARARAQREEAVEQRRDIAVHVRAGASIQEGGGGADMGQAGGVALPQAGRGRGARARARGARG